MQSKRPEIITMQADATNLNNASMQIINWAKQRESRYTCVSNVHMCIETHDKADFREIVNTADMVVADGRPIFWAQRLLGFKQAEQIRGTDLTLEICREASKQNISVGFYGGEPKILKLLQEKLKNRYPSLDITVAISPPFRQLTRTEKQADINTVNSNSTQILFVGLGCPKQEVWMHEHKNRINAVMIGVGAAFDFIAGNKKEAPMWIQASGLEWLLRLIDEPKRLWRRYLYTNPKFIALLLIQLITKKTFR